MTQQQTKILVAVICLFAITFLGYRIYQVSNPIVSPSSPSPTTNNFKIKDPAVSGKVLAYRIVEKEDTSYLGCRRIGIRIVVSDSASKEDTKATMDSIITSFVNTGQWDDITVWAWKLSEISLVGQTPSTMGMQSVSTCK